MPTWLRTTEPTACTSCEQQGAAYRVGGEKAALGNAAKRESGSFVPLVPFDAVQSLRVLTLAGA